MSEMRKLRMLVELERRGTITAVADALAYSTSGISQQLGQLERELGAELVEPEGRRLRLTAEGLALVRAAPAVLDAWEEARAAVAGASSLVAGPVRVAMFQTALLALGAELSTRLASRHPQLELSIVQAEPEQAVPAVLAREIDLALVERYPGASFAPPSGLSEHAMGEDAMLLAVPEGEHASVSLVDLASRPWAMELRGSEARAWAEAQCRGAGFEPLVAFETADMVAQCDLVRAGTAVAFIPALMPEAYTRGLRLLPETGSRSETGGAGAGPGPGAGTAAGAGSQSRSLVLVCRSGAERHPAMSAVRDAVAEILRPNPPGRSAAHPPILGA